MMIYFPTIKQKKQRSRWLSRKKQRVKEKYDKTRG